jgi:transposase-like protein
MAVNEDNLHEQTGDYRSRPRWSAGKKMDAVLRLLRGEPMDVLSRELGVEAHRLAAWRDDFLAGGKQALKGQRPTDHPMTGRSSRLSARSAGRSPGTQDRVGQLDPGAPAVPVQQPDLHGRPERLDHRIVVAVPNAAHRGDQSGVPGPPG